MLIPYLNKQKVTQPYIIHSLNAPPYGGKRCAIVCHKIHHVCLAGIPVGFLARLLAVAFSLKSSTTIDAPVARSSQVSNTTCIARRLCWVAP